MNPLLILLLGAIGAAILGLIGIALTKHDGKRMIDLIREEDMKSYRAARLMKEGLAFCTVGKHEFILLIGGSQTACPECLPVPMKNIWEPHYRMEHKARPLNFGKSYAPLYQMWPELFERGDDNELRG